MTLLQAQRLGELTPKDIVKVYSGRANSWGNHCRCGCQGSYRYSTGVDIAKERGYAGDAEDVNDRQVAKALRIVQDNIVDATAADDCEWFDVELPTGRSYTIYVR